MSINYYKDCKYNSDYDIDTALKDIDNDCNSKINEIRKLDDVHEIRKESKKIQKQRIIKKEEVLNQKGLEAHLIDDVYLPFNPNWTKVAVNLSGGADSACLTFLLSDIILKNNYNCKIDIITHTRVYNARPWAGPVSKKVYQKLKQMYPTVIGERYTNFIPPELEHGAIGNVVGKRSADQITVDSFNTYIQYENDYDAIFNATTKNPSMDVPTQDRMRNRDINLSKIRMSDLAMNKANFWRIMPLKMIEKDWVVKQYMDHDKLDLFKTTRSCEGDGNGVDNLSGLDLHWYKNNQDRHIPECGQCFWCVERQWAMKENKLEF
jgi:hypothetical protein